MPTSATREEHEAVTRGEVRQHGVGRDRAPVGISEQRGHGVGEEGERQQQEAALGPGGGAEDDECPQADGRDRDRDEARDAEELECGADARELRDHEAEIGDEQARHCERGGAPGALLTDQRDEPLAGVRPEARRHLLHHDERDGHQDHEEQGAVRELRAGRRIRGDAAGVVAGVGRDEAGPEDREHGGGPAGPNRAEMQRVEPNGLEVEARRAGAPSGASARSVGRRAMAGLPGRWRTRRRPSHRSPAPASGQEDRVEAEVGRPGRRNRELGGSVRITRASRKPG